MAGEIGRIVGIAVALSLIFGTAATSLTNASASAPEPMPSGSGMAVEPSPSAPVDATPIEFVAFRSYGLPIVPGQPFYLKVSRTVPTGPLRFVEVVGETTVELGAPPGPWAGP